MSACEPTDEKLRRNSRKVIGLRTKITLFVVRPPGHETLGRTRKPPSMKGTDHGDEEDHLVTEEDHLYRVRGGRNQRLGACLQHDAFVQRAWGTILKGSGHPDVTKPHLLKHRLDLCH